MGVPGETFLLLRLLKSLNFKTYKKTTSFSL